MKGDDSTMKIELPEKFVKEPTGYPFSPVLAVEGKELVINYDLLKSKNIYLLGELLTFEGKM